MIATSGNNAYVTWTEYNSGYYAILFRNRSISIEVTPCKPPFNKMSTQSRETDHDYRHLLAWGLLVLNYRALQNLLLLGYGDGNRTGCTDKTVTIGDSQTKCKGNRSRDSGGYKGGTYRACSVQGYERF